MATIDASLRTVLINEARGTATSEASDGGFSEATAVVAEEGGGISPIAETRSTQDDVLSADVRST